MKYGILLAGQFTCLTALCHVAIWLLAFYILQAGQTPGRIPLAGDSLSLSLLQTAFHHARMGSPSG